MVYLFPCFGNIIEVTGVGTLETLLVPAVVVSIEIDVTPALGAALANKSFCHRLPLKFQILARLYSHVTIRLALVFFHPQRLQKSSKKSSRSIFWFKWSLGLTLYLNSLPLRSRMIYPSLSKSLVALRNALYERPAPEAISRNVLLGCLAI